MNNITPKQKIILAVLGVVLIGAILRAVLTSPTPPLPPGAGADANQPNAPQQSTAAAAPASAGTAPAPTAAATPQTAGIDIEQLRASLKTDIFQYTEYKIERDVFRPLVGEQSYATGETTGEGPPPPVNLLADTMDLTGIIWDASRPMAIINQQIVYPGYRFGSGITVDSIEQSRVLLRVSDDTVALELQENPLALEE